MSSLESKTRKLFIRWIYIVLSVVYIYTAGFGMFDDLMQRSLLISLCGFALFLQYPLKIKGGANALAKVVDWMCALTFLIAGLYVVFVWKDRIMKTGSTPMADIIMGSILIIFLLIITYKTTGWFLVAIAGVFLLYALYGQYFPRFLAHRGETWSRLVTFLYVSTEGIFGVPAGIAATFIIMFVVFGSFLEAFGAGQWFVDMAYALTGRFRGGPAKTAIVASGLMGMISGSPAANVVTTGSFTIPLMDRSGYKPHEAGAICAVASTGGMFTPPVMGAAAFIMAEYLEIPYLSVAASAIMPALLYYLCLMLVVDAIAVKNNLVGIPKTQLQSIKVIMAERGLFAVPIVFLVGAIVLGWSPMKAAFWSTLFVVGISFLKKATRPTIHSIINALENSSRQVSSIVITCATAGIVVGVFAITGLGAKLSYTLINISGGNVFIAAVLAAVVTLILGCGMPPTPVYIILATVIVPPLIQLGVAPISAHMFIFIFSCIGAITPPVAIAAYAAAGIAKSEPNRTGVLAFRYGLVAYIIPFLFLLSPALLLEGGTREILLAIPSSIIGVLSLVAAIEGYIFIHWSAVPRCFLAVAALLLIDSGLITDIIGLVFILLALLLNQMVFRRKKLQTGREES